MSFLFLWLTPHFPSAHNPFTRVSEYSSVWLRVRYLVLHCTYHPLKRWRAFFWVRFLKRFCGLRVIAITGSSGKSSTKEMLVSCLATECSVVSSRNIDPIYELPDTLLRCTPRTQIVVVELSVEYPGEMDWYTWLCLPDVAIFTVLGMAHGEFLGGVEGIVQEKGRLLKALPPTGYALLNSTDERQRSLARKHPALSIHWYAGVGSDFPLISASSNASGNTDIIVSDGDVEHSCQVPRFGTVMVQNALAAITCARLEGISWKSVHLGLKSARQVPHRMVIHALSNGCMVIDDTYNSNPPAVKAAITSGIECAAGRSFITVLGEMLELGNESEDLHREIGRFLPSVGVSSLIGYTEGARPIVEGATEGGAFPATIASTAKEVVSALRAVPTPWCVLVKGSRSLRMEHIVEEILSTYA